MHYVGVRKHATERSEYGPGKSTLSGPNSCSWGLGGLSSTIALYDVDVASACAALVTVVFAGPSPVSIASMLSGLAGCNVSAKVLPALGSLPFSN